jgi:hypothetical protein
MGVCQTAVSISTIWAKARRGLNNTGKTKLNRQRLPDSYDEIDKSLMQNIPLEIIGRSRSFLLRSRCMIRNRGYTLDKTCLFVLRPVKSDERIASKNHVKPKINLWLH